MPRNPDCWCIIAGLWRRAGSRSRSRSCLFWILLLLWSSNEYLTSRTALSAPSSAGWDPAISCCSSLLVLQTSGAEGWEGTWGIPRHENLYWTGQLVHLKLWLESNFFCHCVCGFFPLISCLDCLFMKAGIGLGIDNVGLQMWRSPATVMRSPDLC